MSNEAIKLFSEFPLDISFGNVYLFRGETAFVKADFSNLSSACYVNFPFEEAVKVSSGFDNLDSHSRNELLTYIGKKHGLRLDDHDYLSKFLVVLFHELQSQPVLVVGFAGLGQKAIELSMQIIQAEVRVAGNRAVIFIMPFASMNGDYTTSAS